MSLSVGSRVAAALSSLILAASTTDLSAEGKFAAPSSRPSVGIDTTFGERYHAAQAAFHADRWPETITTTTAALAMKPDPKNASILLTWRAYAYSSLSRPAEALRDLDQAIRADPRASYAHSNRALIRVDRGEFDLAVSDLTEDIRQHPKEAELYGIRGSAYLRLGQRERARADLERGITAPAKNSNEFVRRGKANFFLGRYKQAGADFARAASLSSKQSAMLNQLAWFQATCPDAALRDGKAAVRNATRACELSEWRDGAAIDTLAVAYGEVGDFKQAMRYATQAASMPAEIRGNNAEINDHVRALQQGKPWRDQTHL